MNNSNIYNDNDEYDDEDFYVYDYDDWCIIT